MRALLAPCLFLVIPIFSAQAQVQPRTTTAPARTSVSAEKVQATTTPQEKQPAWWRNMMPDATRQNLPLVHEDRALGLGTTAFTVQIVEPVWEVLTPSAIASVAGVGTARPGSLGAIQPRYVPETSVCDGGDRALPHQLRYRTGGTAE
ncbi:MAG: hypothetical protein LKM36_12015 [Flavobacteriales bacterium]|nr:hypothetical protein [Flavobacteriales bacterium]